MISCIPQNASKKAIHTLQYTRLLKTPIHIINIVYILVRMISCVSRSIISRSRKVESTGSTKKFVAVICLLCTAYTKQYPQSTSHAMSKKVYLVSNTAAKLTHYPTYTNTIKLHITARSHFNIFRDDNNSFCPITQFFDQMQTWCIKNLVM